MLIELVDAIVGDGNLEAPLTYVVDGVRKQITWFALSALFVDRFHEEGQYQTEEQRLLARIVSENWNDADNWWVGARASSDPCPGIQLC